MMLLHYGLECCDKFSKKVTADFGVALVKCHSISMWREQCLSRLLLEHQANLGGKTMRSQKFLGTFCG